MSVIDTFAWIAGCHASKRSQYSIREGRDAGINTRGTIFYESVQILAFTDDIDIIGRTQKSLIWKEQQKR
jgi:hypothetical protein